MVLNLGVLFFFVGVLLTLSELFFPTFYFFPVGVALMVSGLFFSFFGNFLLSALFFFLVAAFGYYISFKYLRKVKELKEVFEELKEQKGVVIGKVDQFTYKVRFPLGAAGEEVWNAYSEKELSYGDKVEVVGVKGNKLLVKKVENA